MLGGMAVNQIGSFLSARRTKKKSETMRNRQYDVADGMSNPLLDQRAQSVAGRNSFRDASQVMNAGLGGSFAAQRSNDAMKTSGMSRGRSGAMMNIGEQGRARTLGSAVASTSIGMQQANDQTLAGLLGQQNQLSGMQAQIKSGANTGAFNAQMQNDPWTSMQEFGGQLAGMGMDRMNNNMMLGDMGYGENGTSASADYGKRMRSLQDAQVNYLSRDPS